MAKRKAPVAETEVPQDAPGEALPREDAGAAGYTVLARRYRPRQFGDLIGQEPVAQALTNALQSGRVAHAYLFTGARGVGKTSTARILAKALNCEQGPTLTPCDQCEMCRSIAAGEDVDVLEIDGASNRGIDEVREIRANVQYRPSRARYKIYIIDEVHMLTQQAFNALLKTLEEPPPHVKFIFATTEANKIPITILSRCQRFDFAGIGQQRIVDHLREIVQREQMQADEEALTLVARRAGGSMRDAQSLLDQLLAFGSERLTVDQVHRLLGTAGEEHVAGLAQAVLAQDGKLALELLGQGLDQGLQIGELLDQLIDWWRDLLVAQACGNGNLVLGVAGERRDLLVEQARRLSLDTILAGMDVLVSARNRLRTSSHGRVLAEMALVRLCRLEQLLPVAQLAQHLVQGTAGEAGVPARRPASPGPLAARPEPVSGTDPSKKNDPVAPEPGRTLPLAEGNLEEILEQLVSRSGIMLSGQIRKASAIAISGPNTLVFRFPAVYNQTDQPGLDGSRRSQIEKILGEIVGHPCQVQVESIPEAVSGEGSAGSRNGAHGSPRPRRSNEDLARNSLVKKAMESLGASVVNRDPEFDATEVAAGPAGVDAEEGDLQEDE